MKYIIDRTITWIAIGSVFCAGMMVGAAVMVGLVTR